jgi:hypothetical protein
MLKIGTFLEVIAVNIKASFCANMTRKKITLEVRCEIAALYAAKVFSVSELAKKFKVCKHAVHTIDRPRSGRPKLFFATDDRVLCRMARANP